MLKIAICMKISFLRVTLLASNNMAVYWNQKGMEDLKLQTLQVVKDINRQAVLIYGHSVEPGRMKIKAHNKN